MNNEWYYYKQQLDFCFDSYTIREMTSVWAGADAQFRYFSDSNNGYSKGIVTINSSSQISYYANSGLVNKGDLAQWDFDGDGVIDHATIISMVYEFFFAGHTNDRAYGDIERLMTSNNVIYITRMK